MFSLYCSPKRIILKQLSPVSVLHIPPSETFHCQELCPGSLVQGGSNRERYEEISAKCVQCSPSPHTSLTASWHLQIQIRTFTDPIALTSPLKYWQISFTLKNALFEESWRENGGGEKTTGTIALTCVLKGF